MNTGAGGLAANAYPRRIAQAQDGTRQMRQWVSARSIDAHAASANFPQKLVEMAGAGHRSNVDRHAVICQQAKFLLHAVPVRQHRFAHMREKNFFRRQTAEIGR